jgi:hypothetical protein
MRNNKPASIRRTFSSGLAGSGVQIFMKCKQESNYYQRYRRAGILAACCLATAAFAAAQTPKLTPLHQFKGAPSDGNYPFGGLVVGPSGALFGATAHGGTVNAGVIYSLVAPAAPGQPWTETILHDFAGVRTESRGGGWYSALAG